MTSLGYDVRYCNVESGISSGKPRSRLKNQKQGLWRLVIMSLIENLKFFPRVRYELGAPICRVLIRLSVGHLSCLRKRANVNTAKDTMFKSSLSKANVSSKTKSCSNISLYRGRTSDNENPHRIPPSLTRWGGNIFRFSPSQPGPDLMG
jgi:hypothetical protein